MRILERGNYVQSLEAARRPYQANYFAMYTSLLDAVTSDPVLMLLPLDDHLVHRGDGIFDTCKCVAGAIYNLDAHLERLVRSAQSIGLAWPGGPAEIARLAVATVRQGGRPDCAVRIVLARGPGSFGVSPFDSPEVVLYIVAYALGQPFMRAHPAGATVRRSLVPPKPAQYASVKNCNYLPNVMMKREAHDWGVDFVVGYDAAGHLTEGATENAGIVTAARELAFPRLEFVLAGTTMLRVAALAEGLRQTGEVTRVSYRDIDEAEVAAASELLLVGTTINVVAATQYEGRPVGTGRPGPVVTRLNALLEADIAGNRALRAPVFAQEA